MADDYNDYFSTFKIGTLGKGLEGNLQEYTKEELKNGVGADGNPINFAQEVFYADGSDFMANKGFVVTFMHEPSGQHVHFKAFINSFNETFSSDWDTQSVYGRTDPIRMFKQTSRSITVSLMVPAASEAEGFENLSRIQKLTSYLYPTYESIDNALTISQSPLIRMKIMNMITNNSSAKTTGTYDNIRYLGAKNLSGEGAAKGLLGVIRSLSVNHNVDNPDLGTFHFADGVIIPRAIEITLDFDVIHERTLGWLTQENEEGEYTGQNFSDTTFPYGVNFKGSNPNSKEEIAAEMRMKIGATTQARLDQIEEDNERKQNEQMLQNAIAAGHVVASGVVGGVTQFKLSKAGENASDRIRAKSLAGKPPWYNPFGKKPYPDEASKGDALEYRQFLEEGNFNEFL